MMNRKVLFWPLAAVLLTACEKGLDEGQLHPHNHPLYTQILAIIAVLILVLF